MSELPLSIQKSARKYEPINAGGVILYPIRVKEYDEFLMARPALEVLHQSLPVRYLRLPLLAALYQMDYDLAASQEAPTGLFSRALLCIALALRLGEGYDIEKRLKMFRVVADAESPRRLTEIRCTLNGEEIISITPQRYTEIRAIIAAQNGIKLESDRADPDLVQAEKDISEMSGVPLDASVDDLISAVAALSGTEEAEIVEWPILKLTKRQRAFQRVLDYVICGIGQVNGTTWKGGNPHPHPFFDRKEDGFGAHMALGAFAGGAGERAVANAGQQVN